MSVIVNTHSSLVNKLPTSIAHLSSPSVNIGAVGMGLAILVELFMCNKSQKMGGFERELVTEEPTCSSEGSAPTHWLLRIGDGIHFNSSSSKFIWGIDGSTPFGTWFKSNVKSGDFLWFVKSASKGQLVAVATFTTIQPRIIGPLIALTQTDAELGWDKTEGTWDIEVHYTNLYNLSSCRLFSEIKGAATFRKYSEKCAINLPSEYPRIVRYAKVTTRM